MIGRLFRRLLVGGAVVAGLSACVNDAPTAESGAPESAAALPQSIDRPDATAGAGQTGGSVQNAGSASLAATSWRLRAIDGAPADSNITIVFGADNRLSGNGGCNRYFADFTQGAGATLTIGPIGRSKKLCRGPKAQQESRYFSRLRQVSSFAVEGNTLQLKGGGGQLTFAAL